MREVLLQLQIKTQHGREDKSRDGTERFSFGGDSRRKVCFSSPRERDILLSCPMWKVSGNA